DGHVSHCTWQFFSFCLANKIIPLCLPAHSTHLLQPLDVGLFGPYQRNYSNALDGWLQDGNVGIHKGTFYPLLLQARKLTFTKKNILSAFEATGINPLKP
ncbi:CENP-B protein, partial [Morchella conica CCBAS932]